MVGQLVDMVFERAGELYNIAPVKQ